MRGFLVVVALLLSFSLVSALSPSSVNTTGLIHEWILNGSYADTGSNNSYWSSNVSSGFVSWPGTTRNRLESNSTTELVLNYSGLSPLYGKLNVSVSFWLFMNRSANATAQWMSFDGRYGCSDAEGIAFYYTNNVTQAIQIRTGAGYSSFSLTNVSGFVGSWGWGW